MTYVAANVNVFNVAYAGAVEELAACRPELTLSHVPLAVAEAIDRATLTLARPLSEVEYFSIQRWSGRVVKTHLPANLERGPNDTDRCSRSRHGHDWSHSSDDRTCRLCGASEGSGSVRSGGDGPHA